ncbi:MAG: radical SAM family heme chaperone HemW, partial [Eubacteriaceae bacterium]|nr:radical SAM family heme chaperone HemW [Eubacteriaceae bacterium]
MTESTGIYIHIPFCASKCAYCDFVSFAGRENRISSYFEALLNEINSYDFSGAVNSVYIGGGTPSFVDEKYIARLMSALGKRFSLAEDCEISVESNPNSLTYGKLLSFKNCGINRLSMGVQSADDSVLKLIGRTHNQADSLKALEAIHRAGMVNFNLDIMFSLPGQSIASFRDSLKFAMESGAKHISCYGLSVEENTPLYDLYEKGVFSQNDETDRIMYHTAADMLSGAGFERYA